LKIELISLSNNYIARVLLPLSATLRPFLSLFSSRSSVFLSILHCYDIWQVMIEWRVEHT